MSKFKDEFGKVREFFTTARWEAIVTYASDVGPVDIEYQLDSLADLARLMAGGPDLHTVLGINVTYLGYRDPTQSLAVSTLEGVGMNPLADFLAQRRAA